MEKSHSDNKPKEKDKEKDKEKEKEQNAETWIYYNLYPSSARPSELK